MELTQNPSHLNSTEIYGRRQNLFWHLVNQPSWAFTEPSSFYLVASKSMVITFDTTPSPCKFLWVDSLLSRFSVHLATVHIFQNPVLLFIMGTVTSLPLGQSTRHYVSLFGCLQRHLLGAMKTFIIFPIID